ncbi:hypothetical protein HanXRQr2_Chr07g0296551 [Helianthus annuus]|uniref:Uncharacterized protein n=1 Tax=Helianthus annuus TaxID=4232 RepID=A0A9K3ILE9_HELAN|nr:hypothetical protein HanXRQr2_Chr07g0296551 [Helianthus annuus]KAJ0556997.1 hypothetical protein HanIR_Chr07g0320141 [Helianthus annuus]
MNRARYELAEECADDDEIKICVQRERERERGGGGEDLNFL